MSESRSTSWLSECSSRRIIRLMFPACFNTISAHTPATAANSHAGSVVDQQRDRHERRRRPRNRGPPCRSAFVTTHHTATNTGAMIGYSTTSTPAAGGDTLAPTEVGASPGTCGRGSPPRRTRRPAGRPSIHRPSPAASAPLSASRPNTHAPLRQPSARVTFEAPGLPDPNVAMSTPLAPGDDRRARERAEDVGRDDRERCGHGAVRSATADGDRIALGANARAGLEWSIIGRGAGLADGRRAAPLRRGRSTHSGSGPSSGRPVKNLAAMQPPWQAS